MSVPTRYVPSVSMIVLGADGPGAGLVTETVLVISTVDVTVTAVWVDPPQPARTIAAPAIAAFFPCIGGRVSKEYRLDAVFV